MASFSHNFSIDLLEKGETLLSFLERTDEKCQFMNTASLAVTYERYIAWQRKRFQLRKDAQIFDEFKAPFDVCYVWLAHLIRTPIYRQDLATMFGIDSASTELDVFCRESWHAAPLPDSESGEISAKIWDDVQIAEQSEFCKTWHWEPNDDAMVGNLEKLGEGLIPVWNKRFFVLRKLTSSGGGILECWRDDTRKDLRGYVEYRASGVTFNEDNMAGPIFKVTGDSRTYSLKAESIGEARRWVSVMRGEQAPVPRAPLDIDARFQLKLTFLLEDFQWLPDLRSGFDEYRSGDRAAFLKRALTDYVDWHARAHRNEIDGKQGPTLDLDLFWHAHIIEPAAYKADSERLFGRVIWHRPAADGVNDDDDDDNSSSGGDVDDIPARPPSPPMVPPAPPVRCARLPDFDILEPIGPPVRCARVPDFDIIGMIDSPVRCSRLPDFDIPDSLGCSDEDDDDIAVPPVRVGEVRCSRVMPLSSPVAAVEPLKPEKIREVRRCKMKMPEKPVALVLERRCSRLQEKPPKTKPESPVSPLVQVRCSRVAPSSLPAEQRKKIRQVRRCKMQKPKAKPDKRKRPVRCGRVARPVKPKKPSKP